MTQWQLGLHHNHSPIWTDTRSTLPRSTWQSLVCQHRYHMRGYLPVEAPMTWGDSMSPITHLASGPRLVSTV